jgi:translation initiation factor 2 gamma subunit (eIF-2gamma)
LTNGPIRTGDRIAYELLIDFMEEEIETLEVAGSPVNDASPGAQVGIKTNLLPYLRKGTKVYLVQSGSSKQMIGLHHL